MLYQTLNQQAAPMNCNGKSAVWFLYLILLLNALYVQKYEQNDLFLVELFSATDRYVFWYWRNTTISLKRATWKYFSY
jgi:hypothetical protein